MECNLLLNLNRFNYFKMAMDCSSHPDVYERIHFGFAGFGKFLFPLLIFLNRLKKNVSECALFPKYHTIHII